MNSNHIHDMIQLEKEFEKMQTYERIIVWSRLPEKISFRRGYRFCTYTLKYGDIDDRVFLGYVDEMSRQGSPYRVLMHYEESTLENCISKAWRNLAENHIKIKVKR